MPRPIPADAERHLPRLRLPRELIAFFAETRAWAPRRGAGQVGPAVIRLGLFRPPSRALALAKATRLLRELADAIEAGRVDRRGRSWAAPVSAWRSALETVVEARARLVLPLRNHNYLFEIVAGLAHQAEGALERQTEARRRAGAHREQPPAERDTTDPVLARELLQSTLAKLKGQAMTAQHISTELLPPLVAEVADVVGHDAAMRLVERYGGWRLYVPATLGDDHELVAIIGRAAADRLVERYATDTLWLPLCRR